MSNDLVLRRKSLKTQPSPHSLVCTSLYFLFHDITIIIIIVIIIIACRTYLKHITIPFFFICTWTLYKWREVISCKLWDIFKYVLSSWRYHHQHISWSSPPLQLSSLRWSWSPLSSSRGSPPSPPTTAKAQGVGRGECLNNFPDKTSPSLWPDRASQRPNSSLSSEYSNNQLSSEYSNNHYHQNIQTIIIVRIFKKS